MKIHRPGYFTGAVIFSLLAAGFTIWGFTIEPEAVPKEDNIFEALFNIFDEIWNSIVALIKALILFIIASFFYFGALLFFYLSINPPKNKINRVPPEQTSNNF